MFKKESIWSLICFFLSLFLCVGVMTVFHACGRKDDGTWMHCHTAQIYVAAGAALLCILFLISMLLKKQAVCIATGILGAIGNILILFIPGSLVPMCMMHTMRCYTVMQPFVRIMAAAIAFFCILSVFQTRKKARRGV